MLLAPPTELQPELEEVEGAGPHAPEVRQVVPAALVVHSPSPSHPRHVSLAVPPLAHTGAVPLQVVPLVHWTHSPKAALLLSVSQAAVPPVQPPSWPTSVLLHWRQ